MTFEYFLIDSPIQFYNMLLDVELCARIQTKPITPPTSPLPNDNENGSKVSISSVNGCSLVDGLREYSSLEDGEGFEYIKGLDSVLEYSIHGSMIPSFVTIDTTISTTSTNIPVISPCRSDPLFGGSFGLSMHSLSPLSSMPLDYSNLSKMTSTMAKIKLDPIGFKPGSIVIIKKRLLPIVYCNLSVLRERIEASPLPFPQNEADNGSMTSPAHANNSYDHKKEGFKETLSRCNLLDLNVLLYRCDSEERDDQSKYNIYIYI
jgi:hypothetical protein